MSGLLRNLIAFVIGLFAFGSKAVADVIAIRFLITPFDAGVRVLKSDKYLQFAETAQLAYLLKTGKLFIVLQAGASFVNVAQLVKFARPIPIFARVRVDTQLIFADERCAYFSHILHVSDRPAAEVLVKMKFKKGRMTVPPTTFLLTDFAGMPEAAQRFEHALMSAEP